MGFPTNVVLTNEDVFFQTGSLVSRSFTCIIDQETTHLYPTEFLNSVNISGMPQHKLALKIGQPVICLRNVNTCEGLCNGIRFIIRKLHTRIIEAENAIGVNAGKIVYVKRMPLTPSGTDLPFDLNAYNFHYEPYSQILLVKVKGKI